MPYKTEVLGWMVESELKVLETIAKQVPVNGNIVEVGSMFGRSAVCFAMSADPSVTINCIDYFPTDMRQQHGCSDEDSIKNGFPIANKLYNVEQDFIENTKEFSNIKMIKGDSPHLLVYTPDPIDLFFLDAGHSNPNDWDNLCHFIPYMKLNGVIAGHDYHPTQFPDVCENVRRLEELFDIKAELYPGSSIWSIKVTKLINKV